MARIALFASGTASNARRILEDNGYLSDTTQRASDPADHDSVSIVCAFSDRENSGIHALAQAAGIPCETVSYQSGRAQAERYILSRLLEFRVDLLVLAGYMRILSPSTVRAYPRRILNIHPSLLPSFPGMHAIERSFAADIPRAGVTVHLVDAGVDTGPVLAQASFERSVTTSLASFEQEIHTLEHALYPGVLEQVAEYIDNGLWPDAELDAARLRAMLPDRFRLED